MIRLKLKDPFDQVFVNLSMESPGTGKRRTIDAKVDTGSVVTVVPMYMAEGLGLEVLETRKLTLANGMSMEAYVCNCIVSLSEDDVVEMPIYISKARKGIALIGMDILKYCNYVQWHDCDEQGNHIVRFDLELLSF